MQTLASGNFLESVEQALNVLERNLDQVSDQDLQDLLEQYRKGADTYSNWLKSFLARAQEINTYDVVQPTISWA